MKKPNNQMQEVLDNLEKLNNEPLEEVTPAIARQQAEVKDAVLATINDHLIKRAMGFIEAVEFVEHDVIPTKSGDLLVRIYRPMNEKDLTLPACLYFHGGGMVIANLNTYDASCRAICNAADCVVISVAYRQAPEYPFPTACFDAFNAYEWVLNHASVLGIDENRIAVCGESAGGNLAAGVCLQAKDKGIKQPIHQVLIYPMVDCNFDTPSYQEHEFAVPLNKAMMKWFWSHYLEGKATIDDPYACPLKYKDFSHLAPATVVLAEIDPLCSEGQAYADKLQEAGVEVRCKEFKEVTHEFFGMGAVVDEANVAVQFVAEGLLDCFYPPQEGAEETLPIVSPDGMVLFPPMSATKLSKE